MGSRRRLTDTTPWITDDRPAPEPVRDELYEAWKALDPRHTGVMARHAWNACWEAARNYFKENPIE